MINILGKVNKHNFRKFDSSDFIGYEIFLGGESDFKHLPGMMERLNIASVHQPAKNFNLASTGAKGEKSYRLMVKLLSRLKDFNFNGVMVIHGVFYNENLGGKAACLKILAKRLDRLSQLFPKIKISLESDILFFNQVLDNRTLMSSPEDFLELKKYLKSQLYITLDIEHALISSLYRDFTNKHQEFYFRIKNLADLKKPASQAAKTAWLGYLRKNKIRLDEIISASLRKYEQLSGAIIQFHLSPSNMLKYWYDEKTFVPLEGEHLSAGQTGDKLNYSLIFKHLPRLTRAEPINVVLEIWPRRLNRYVPELKKSGRLIKKYAK